MKERVQPHDETDRDTSRDRKKSGCISEVLVVRGKVQFGSECGWRRGRYS